MATCVGVTIHAPTELTCGGIDVVVSELCRLRLSSLPSSSGGSSTLLRYRGGGYQVVSGEWSVSGTVQLVSWFNGHESVNDSIVTIHHTLPFGCGRSTTTTIGLTNIDPCTTELRSGPLYTVRDTTEPYSAFDAPTSIVELSSGSVVSGGKQP